MNSSTKKICIVLIAILLAWLNILISCKKELLCENCRVDTPLPPPPPSINLCNSNRPHVNAQLIPIGTLSEPRDGMSAGSAGNKILFAGGLTVDNGLDLQQSSRVDIYDLVSQTWSTAELCAGRSEMAAVSNGSIIVFAGGESFDGTWPVDSVDIYDASSNSWWTSHLSIPGHNIVGAAVNKKFVFAGGEGGFTGAGRETQIDILDVTTGLWSTSQLSEAKRGGHAAVTVGNKIYIGGGSTLYYSSNKIDIYDNDTNSWSVDSLTQSKTGMAAITVGQKIFWAGGWTGSFLSGGPSCMVEIMDSRNGNRALQNLFEPAEWNRVAGSNAVMKDGKIIFIRNYGTDRDKFDIYDIASDSWSIGVLSQSVPRWASVICVNNTIYIAGGVDGTTANLSNQVYKLEF